MKTYWIGVKSIIDLTKVSAIYTDSEFYDYYYTVYFTDGRSGTFKGSGLIEAYKNYLDNLEVEDENYDR